MAGEGDEPQKGKQSDAGDRIESQDSEKESPFDSHELLNHFNDVVGKKKDQSTSADPAAEATKSTQDIPSSAEAKTKEQAAEQQTQPATRGVSSDSQTSGALAEQKNAPSKKDADGADKRESESGESNPEGTASRGGEQPEQAQKAPDATGKDAKPDGQLPEMSDLFSQIDSFDTRGLNKNSSRQRGDTSRKPPTKAAESVDKPAAPAQPAAPQEATSIVGTPSRMNRDNPTVAFVDSFTANDTQDLGRGTNVTHGEFSAASAEANGFNSFRVQANIDNGANFAGVLQNVEKKVNTGELPLGRGDVVNISLGNPDLTFEQASQVFGFEINKDNLAQNKDRILEKAREISQDNRNSEDLRQVFDNIVKSNEVISRLQEKGITVMHAAGNGGPEKFSLEFMNANVQLNSQTGGRPDAFSAAHNLTTPGDGKFKFTRDADLTSSTPIRDQRGVVKVEGANVSFPVSGMGNGLIGGLRDVDTASVAQSTMDNQPKPEKLPLPSNVLSPNTDLTLGAFSKKGPKQDFSLPSPSGDPLVKFSFTAKTKNANDQIQISDKPPSGTPASGVLVGTSFSNIRTLQEMRPQLLKMKKQKQ